MKTFANNGAPAPAASENTSVSNQARVHEQRAPRPHPARRNHPRGAQAVLRLLLLAFALLALAPGGRALTLEELQNDPHLTPERLAAQFSQFKFELRAEVQPPQKFLERRAGDCDDFATLAADVLRARGYTPHLVEVRMPGYLHAVCYVAETRSYLDYNRRGSFRRAVPCHGSLTDIAARVARSFNTEWTAVAEFSWERGNERTLQTVVREHGRWLLMRPGAAPVAIQRTKDER